ncbi:hypothetical protein K431DRAFT_276674 [Polychaeton citri CBS 116435]|uniref:Zn(2)-C6 fungal-type domain-containing protein n=1 Tax=Polychaeton citri CBS 116435 TaxID=1314669 RepID=A0A9P4Q0P5_9PEZI|nr:hypothetical protein K431DRAFT_276674 [Polychaeton citri CBS 116435]
MRDTTAAGERKVAYRRYAPKTRTGCVTCKIRRVKCDEAKPVCNRCASTGRKCDGYAPAETNGALVKYQGSRKHDDPVFELRLDISTDALERRTLSYFKERTGPCLSGYFPDHVIDRLLLQACHREPTVRYAVSALSALHEEKELTAGLRKEHDETYLVPHNSYPMQQYGKALQGLQQLLKSGSVDLDLVLICCVVCIHFESIREQFIPAMVHLDNAIKLLKDRGPYEEGRVERSLVRTLMRMDIQSSIYLGSRVPSLPYYTANVDTELSEDLQDLTQARDVVTVYTDRFFHFLRKTADPYVSLEPGNVPLETYAKAQEFSSTFKAIEGLLWDFIHKPHIKLSFREQYGLNMLRTRVKLNKIQAGTCLFAEGTLYDSYLDDFDEMLTLCNFMMNSDPAHHKIHSVSLDEGLLHPLYYIATHCRDGRMRWKALSLLKCLPKGAGVWHYRSMTAAAQVVVEFEEALTNKPQGTALCEDIPEWRRVHFSNFDGYYLASRRRQVMLHYKTLSNGIDGEWTDMRQEVRW